MQAIPQPSDCCSSCGTTQTYLTTPGPAGAAGAAGADGLDGQNAFTTLLSAFTVPANSATGTAIVESTAWMTYGQIVVLGDPIEGYGYFRVVDIIDSTHVSLQNLEDGINYTDNLPPGTVLPVGTQVSPGGAQGAAASAFSWVQFFAVNAVGVGDYLVGHLLNTSDTSTFTASLNAIRPVGTNATFELVVDGVLTGHQITILAGVGYEHQQISGVQAISSGSVSMWQMVAGPADIVDGPSNVSMIFRTIV